MKQNEFLKYEIFERNQNKNTCRATKCFNDSIIDRYIISNSKIWMHESIKKDNS